MIRRLLLAAGVVAVVLGLALVAVPGLAGGVAVSRILVYVIGVIALLVALARIQRRRKSERTQTTTPEPETPTGLPRPGSDVDTRIRNLRRLTGGGRVESERQELDARLEELAVRVVARREDLTREEARSRLVDGSWTDDPLAAAYFSEDVELTRRQRFRLSVGTGSAAGVYAARAIEALAGRAPASATEADQGADADRDGDRDGDGTAGGPPGGTGPDREREPETSQAPDGTGAPARADGGEGDD